MNKWRNILGFCLAGIIAISGCKKDEGLPEDQKDSYLKKFGAAATGADMIRASDGGLIMLGTTNAGTSSDLFLVKTDEYGNQQWARNIDGGQGNDDIAGGLALTPSGGIAIIGTTQFSDTISGGIPVSIFKSLLVVCDANGNVQYSGAYGTNSRFQDLYGNGIAVDADGNYIMACEARRRGTNERLGFGRVLSGIDYSQIGFSYAFLTKEDPTDTNKTIITNAGFSNAIATSQGTYLMVGNTEFSNLTTGGAQGGVNVMMVEYTSLNNIDTISEGTYGVKGSSDDDEALDVTQNASGNFVTVGFLTNPEGNKDFYITENQSPVSDDPLWESFFECDGNTDDIAYGIYALSDGYLIAGSTETTGHGVQFCMAKTNLNGELLWVKEYGYVGFDEAKAVVETSDGGYAVFGTSSDERGNTNMCLIKTDTKGELK
ncbi:MAG: hypothetical protein RIC15_03215 [Vicingaceae bacterium]